MNAAVARLSPGVSTPTALSSGQSGRAGSAPPATLRDTVSWFMKVTRSPTAIVISLGIGPVDMIITVDGSVWLGSNCVGEEGVPDPQEPPRTAAAAIIGR